MSNPPIAVVLVIAISYVVLHNVEGASELCKKVPKAFYCKLTKICDNIQTFSDCMVEKKACTKDEAKELKNMFVEKYKVCEKMPDCKGDPKVFLNALCEMEQIPDIKSSLEKFASKVGALMKCTK